MKKLLIFLLAFSVCMCLAACGEVPSVAKPTKEPTLSQLPTESEPTQYYPDYHEHEWLMSHLCSGIMPVSPIA